MIGKILKHEQIYKCVCIHKIIPLITMKMKIKMKNILHRCNFNRPSSRHGHKYSEKCLSMTMLICIKQLARNIWSLIYENVELIRRVAYKKSVYILL